MPHRRAAIWIVVGTLAVVGGFWLTTRTMQLSHLEGGWIPFAGHFVGAMLAGAMMVAHAPLRPWREPVAAGGAAVGVLALLFLVLPRPLFSWVAARSASSELMVLALAGILAGGALCGAVIARRFTTTSPHAAKLLLLSTLTITGCAIIAINAAFGSGLISAPDPDNYWVAVMLLAVALGGFVTQWMVSVYRPWICGSGALVFAVLLLGETGITSTAVGAVVRSLFLFAVGAFGARLARPFVTAAASTEQLPPARLN